MSQSKFTIFFSWQSDIKGNTKIIRDSLKAECQKQKEKNGYDIKIDEATRNLSGSPKIEDAVLEKIANADLFVCDVTPIITSADGNQTLVNSKKVLIDFDELKIKRILVYRDSGRYYSQYVYMETYPDKPTGLYHINQDVYKDVMQWRGYFDEEYADFKPAWYFPTRHISRQDYDDGATNIFGKHVELKQRAKLRCRYLTPYNFIICAKGSPYNSREFSNSSEDVFRGMLENEISNEDFNNFMMKFPKRSY